MSGPTGGALAFWSLVSTIFGWAYFAFWSMCFYPQAILNFKNKSVTGLSVDFVVASFLGFLLYAIFTCSMYWNPVIQREYMARHDGDDNLVELNDVIFTLHATAINFVYILQVLLYRKPGENISKVGAASSGLIIIASGIALILAIFNVLPWLDFLYILSYVKLVLTVLKYIPQVYLNYLRKSTSGWSIINVIFDFIGGSLSILQILIDCWISGNWSNMTGFLTKLVLGIVCCIFDTIFMLQHYVWYPNGREAEDLIAMEALEKEANVKDTDSDEYQKVEAV